MNIITLACISPPLTSGKNMSPGVHAWCDGSDWYKFVISIITLVLPKPGDWWGVTPKLHQLTEVSLVQFHDDGFSLSHQITRVGNTFLLSHLGTLPMHSLTNTDTTANNIFVQERLTWPTRRPLQTEFVEDNRAVTCLGWIGGSLSIVNALVW